MAWPWLGAEPSEASEDRKLMARRPGDLGPRCAARPGVSQRKCAHWAPERGRTLIGELLLGGAWKRKPRTGRGSRCTLSATRTR